MPAEILWGREIAAQIRAEARVEAQVLAGQLGRPPGLAVVLVGDDPASKVYVRNKQNACREAGIRSLTRALPAGAPLGDLLGEVARLNADPEVHGIIVQLPLPRRMDEDRVVEAIAPEKDVDGFHPLNVAKLLIQDPTGNYLVPSTPEGILDLLRRSGLRLSGKRAVLLGASNIVGRPLALLLLNAGVSSVALCHIYSRDVVGIAREADLLVSAAGRVGLVTAEMVKPGAIVVDVGTNFVGGKTVGDVVFEEVRERAGWITPVPGGVGPLTVAVLLRSTLKAARIQAGLEQPPLGIEPRRPLIEPSGQD